MTRSNGPFSRNISSAPVSQRVRETTEQMTQSQSLTLVKNLVRISISTVCHIRNIFPTSCFQERTYAGMNIYQLDAATRHEDTNETVVHNQQAYQLTQWLEFGVFEAVERRYLRKMELILVSEDALRPRESYSFELDYPEDGRDTGITFSGTRVTTVENSKAQLVKLIRSLIQFSNTLEEIPAERVVTMKLWYHDERTPTDWEPKYFQAADPEDLSFSREDDHDTLRIRIGEMQTPHHYLKVRFRGIVENPDEDDTATQETARAARGSEAKDGSDEENSPMKPLPTRTELGGLLVCKADHASEDDGEEESGEDEETQAPEPEMRAVEEEPEKRVLSDMANLSVSKVAPGEQEMDETDDDDDDDDDDTTTIMDEVRTWTKKQKRPTIAQARKQLELTKEYTQECFRRMVDEGLLRKDSNYRYHVVTAESPTDIMETESSEEQKRDRAAQNDRFASSSRVLSGSDNSEAEIPETVIKTRDDIPKTNMPPPPAVRRGDRGGTTPDGKKKSENFATPPVPGLTSRCGMQPVPEKPQQEQFLSMGTKRVLDEAELTDNENESRAADPIDMFKMPDTSASVGFEVSLSQGSTKRASRAAKCSLVRQPIRQSKRQRLKGLRGGSREK